MKERVYPCDGVSDKDINTIIIIISFLSLLGVLYTRLIFRGSSQQV